MNEKKKKKKKEYCYELITNMNLKSCRTDHIFQIQTYRKYTITHIYYKYMLTYYSKITCGMIVDGEGSEDG